MMMTTGSRTFDEWCDHRQVTSEERQALLLYLIFLRLRPVLEQLIDIHI